MTSFSNWFCAATAQYMSQIPVDHHFLSETDHKQGNRGHEENVDERAHRKSDAQSQQPQNNEYHGNRPQHLIPLSD